MGFRSHGITGHYSPGTGLKSNFKFPALPIYRFLQSSFSKTEATGVATIADAYICIKICIIFKQGINIDVLLLAFNANVRTDLHHRHRIQWNILQFCSCRLWFFHTHAWGLRALAHCRGIYQRSPVFGCRSPSETVFARRISSLFSRQMNRRPRILSHRRSKRKAKCNIVKR